MSGLLMSHREKISCMSHFQTVVLKTVLLRVVVEIFFVGMGCLCRNFYMRCDRQFQYTLVFLYICVKTHNVHRNKKCAVFHICLFSERYDFCEFDIGCSTVSTNFVKHRTRLGHPLFLSPFTVIRPTQIFGIFKTKKSNDVVTPFFT